MVTWKTGNFGRGFFNIHNLGKLAGKYDLTFASSQVEDWKSPIISLLTFSPHRIGAANFKGGSIYTISAFIPRDLHIGKRDWVLVKLINPRIEPSLPSLSIPEHIQEKARRLLPFEKKGKKRVVFHFFSPWLKFKNWEEEKVIKLGNILARQGIQIVFLGDEEEKECNAFLSARIPHSLDLSGKVPHPLLLAALISRCDLFIGIDSGPAHLSGIMGTPMVLLFGPTPPSLYAPLTGRCSLIQKKLPCSPCYPGLKHCANPRCMKNITVEDVLKKVSSFL
ncbi:glycosyltransferase family 9 protein [Candidatus Calescamantes bacterium]|nr:glycosyltransferase family 9 protein [Candidatus Calescamantes bacterium]